MTTVVNNGLRVSRIYSWQIAPFHCFCLSHGVFNLVKFVKIPTQKFESQLNGINPFSVLWESSQSERLLYENFIIKENTLFAAENDKNCSSPGTEFNYLSLGRHLVDSTLLPTERLREIELLFCELSVLLPSWWTGRLSFPTKTWFLPHTMPPVSPAKTWKEIRVEAHPVPREKPEPIPSHRNAAMTKTGKCHNWLPPKRWRHGERSHQRFAKISGTSLFLDGQVVDDRHNPNP